MRPGSWPMAVSASWCTAVRTVSERPSQVASPQPTTPSVVSTRTKSQRGATRKVSMRAIVSVNAQPFVAPAVRPLTMYFCTNNEPIMIGRVTTVVAAIRPPQSMLA
ncbi:Uncharacterised protein [Mycobacteroides abscessus subsp. abscessus]|nr:Uncharacterised protein [Mycobacteroides abscessus subsp. abscessus]